jgi:hypothetical protein
MKRKLIIGLTLAAAVILAAGCISYDQELVLNEDGSGTVLVRYASDDPDGTAGAPVLSFTEEDIETEYAGSEVRVRDIQVYLAPERKEGPSEAKYYLDFEDIEDLNARGVFAAKDFKTTKDVMTQIFTLDEAGGTTTFTQTCVLDMDVEDPSALEVYTFTYALTCPDAVTTTNGTIGPDGLTVTWSYALTELIESPVKMYAVYGESGETGNGQGSIGPGKTSD